ncbi:MAG: sulfotransferase [Proteobacteria bacterium]|nr:sulfotransferase [Pseudomonadota bacterium]
MAASPSNSDARLETAQRLREDGRHGAAADVVCAMWHEAPADPFVAHAVLAFLKECGLYERALPIARAAMSRWPNDARRHMDVGEIALVLGAFDEASVALRCALDLNPQLGPAWLRLAHCRRFASADEADVQRFRRAWHDAGLESAARVCVGFAYGKALDDLGDYAHAATVLVEANALAHRTGRWRRESWQHALRARLCAASLPSLPRDDDFCPVFVVGMPRSGTTLVASTLARHATVRDRGELNWIPALYALLDEQRRLYDPQALAAIAGVIRAQMRSDDAPARFYLDKNPLNFRYLDFIVACFPNAKIVHCRRGARDTALSIWMQHFAHDDLGFAYDFSDIAAVQQGCVEAMSHWLAQLSVPILDVDYERFVASPDAEQARLWEFLGVSSAESANGKRATQAVTTASVWQVRQPVYAHAVQRWRRYASLLPELTTLFAEHE